METDKRPGRPKNSYKWMINGEGVPATKYYKYKTNLKRLSINKTNNNTPDTLKQLIQLRDQVEVMIKQQLALQVI